MDEDARTFGIRNWWIVAREDEWKWFLEETKVERLVIGDDTLFCFFERRITRRFELNENPGPNNIFS